MIPNLKSANEDPDGGGHNFPNHSPLADSTMVPSAAHHDSRYPNSPSTNSRPAVPITEL